MHKRWEIIIHGRGAFVFKCTSCGLYRDMEIINMHNLWKTKEYGYRK